MDNPNLPSKQNERTERKFAEPSPYDSALWTGRKPSRATYAWIVEITLLPPTGAA